MSGRKKDAIWLHFEEIRDGKSKRARCKKCKKFVVALVARMKAHKEKKCSLVPLHEANNSYFWELASGSRLNEDSMPLQQRMLLSAPQVQIPSSSESLLQSQPLSPTKLKVTRQSNKLPSPFTPSLESPPALPPEEVCLRWNSHHSNMQTSFPQLLEKEQYVDVTLIAEGRTLKCHRIILSSCSAYFEEILNGITPLQHPVIILKGIPFWILKALTDFMYVGEVNIDQNKLPELLDVAELLKVKGLAGKSNGSDNRPKPENHPPAKKPQPKETPRQSVAKIPPQSTPVVAKVEEMPINDPLELLEPKFLEDSDGPTSRMKENRLLTSKKLLNKKIRKRKSSEDEAVAPPLFPMRRGTRSRPNVKIPKYYDYEDIVKPTASDSQPFSPIVTIKSEPLDVEENDMYNESGESLINVSNEIEASKLVDSTNAKSPEKIARAESPTAKSRSLTKEKLPQQYKIKIKCFSSLSERSNCKPANDVSTASVNDATNLAESGDTVTKCDAPEKNEVTNSATETNEQSSQNSSNADEASLSDAKTAEVDSSHSEDPAELSEASEHQAVGTPDKTELQM